MGKSSGDLFKEIVTQIWPWSCFVTADQSVPSDTHTFPHHTLECNRQHFQRVTSSLRPRGGNYCHKREHLWILANNRRQRTVSEEGRPFGHTPVAKRIFAFQEAKSPSRCPRWVSPYTMCNITIRCTELTCNSPSLSGNSIFA